jgi:hypothetical protein
VQWVGQRNANFLSIDLETGRPEPCYESYPNWTAAAQANASIYFNSVDCSGALYADAWSAPRYLVDGVLYEARGPVLGPWGSGTDESVSLYSGTDCSDQSSSTYLEVQELLPGDPEFVDFFDNPPYTVKIVY